MQYITGAGEQSAMAYFLNAAAIRANVLEVLVWHSVPTYTLQAVEERLDWLVASCKNVVNTPVVLVGRPSEPHSFPEQGTSPQRPFQELLPHGWERGCPQH